MAIGPDKVQVIKQESAALGGDNADSLPFDAPIEPQEDALESAGLYLQDAGNRDETTYVAREGNDMIFQDVNNPSPVTLTQLLEVGSGFATSSFDVVLNPPSSELFGTVSGLPGPPIKVIGFSVKELGVPVQSGLFYDTQVVALNADGFDYRISIGLDEWWPGPGAVTLRIQYGWSLT